MKNGTEKYIETVKYLERLFDYCNEKLFNNELEKPVITVQLDSKNKTYGWFTPAKVWKENDNDDGAHEINITAQALNRSVKQIASTMVHEMCHYYAELRNIQDTSRSGTYHNKLFKKIAEQHGLEVKCVRVIGWSHTELKPETDKLITAFVKYNPETIIYRAPVCTGQMVKTSSTRKYVCPCCQQSVRATKQVNIICADCNEPMTVEE
ncbi:MAG: SprT-like domain-containing protein [Clostridia bacterium]|nr:SprT-like domain-containing protein [Clostridia bacterium]MDE7214996.1 SprT-like domain-containing protein [Clostridia bacterium]